MKRILMMVFRNILLVPYMWIKLCYHASHVDKYTEEEHYKMLGFITYRANKGGNVIIDVHGQEKHPKKMDLCSFQITKVCTMYWQLLMRVKAVFCCCKERSC